MQSGSKASRNETLFLYTKKVIPNGLPALSVFIFSGFLSLLPVCFDFLLDVKKNSCLYRQLMLPMAKARGGRSHW